MKKYLSIILILMLFIVFFVVDTKRRREFKVLKIISPETIVVDLNNNGSQDIDETVCVNGVKSYKFDINDTKNIGLWYLANQFALKTLKDKTVKVNFTGQTSPACRFADVKVDNVDYGFELTKNNFNLNKIDKVKLLKQQEAVQKLNLVIYNHKSNKVHKLTCKYGKMAHDIVILPYRQVPKDAKQCKFCFGKKYHKRHFYKHKTKRTYPSVMKDKNIELILSDYTNILKPDRYCTYTFCKTFVKEINSSKSSIDIAAYGFDNIPKVQIALKNAKKRGVKIRVVYDVGKGGVPDYYTETTKFLSFLPKENLQNDLNKKKTITKILMHNKFAIFDKKDVFTGSMNFSATGFSGFNANSVVLIKSSSLAQIYENEFEQMFEGKFHNSKNSLLPHKAGNVRIYFSPQDKIISSQILPLVKGAKHSIYMPTFLITHEELTSALVNARKRGVDIKLIVDATNAKESRSKVKLLRANGIPVKVENYAGKMHSKTMIVDNRYIVLGSMNFSKSGENKNDENCMIIDDTKLAKFYTGFFNYVWNKIPKAYLTHYVAAEGKYSWGSCKDGVDNDFDGKIDMADEACRGK
ncbi:MAG: phospholipase D-like domain-containing protein [Clostridiaceae bacterium]|jgi:phosphatidylserine/phosphatidylglycerophosphate/cardiolipin synthase-like enzyme|nr:phospholipase D-like domain-containing protein [Clostridiaceae bacterium]